MALAQKETHRSEKENREPRNKSTPSWLINLQQRKQEYTVGKRQPLQQCWENKTTFSHIYKNKFKMA